MPRSIQTLILLYHKGNVFMRTVERLQKIKALDRYIDSQIEQIKRLESQALKVTAGATVAPSSAYYTISGLTVGKKYTLSFYVKILMNIKIY